jgi:hypothetical protein
MYEIQYMVAYVHYYADIKVGATFKLSVKEIAIIWKVLNMKLLNQIFEGKCIVLGVYLTISGNRQIAPKADFFGTSDRGDQIHAN